MSRRGDSDFLLLLSRASGGTPTPPFAFPEDEMLLGMGLAGISSFQGYEPFANLMWNCSFWQRQSGSGAFTQEWGELTAATPTDTFYAKLTEGVSAMANLPSGTYTVLNPDGLKVGIGWYGTPNITGWTTATEFTFTKSAEPVIAIYCEGSVTNINGPLAVILPGHRDSYLAGDLFNSAFIDFHEPLQWKWARFMDWFLTYQDLSEEWADSPPVDAILLRAAQTQLKAKVPYLVAIQLANRLGVDFWCNTAPRMSDDCVTQLATLIRDNLSPTLYVPQEHNNESWNFASVYNDQRSWTEHLFNTRYEATPNGSNGWTRTAHGLTTGTLVAQFFARENFVTDNTVPLGSYPLGYGQILYVEKIDNDNFKLYRWSGTVGSPVMGTVVDVPAGLSKLIYKKHAVDGSGVVDLNTNHGIRQKQIWDIFDSVLGRGRVIHVMGTQLVLPSITTNRLAPTGVAAATDMVGCAIYYHGEFWGVSLAIASGQITPSGWAQKTGNAIRVAVYANGSTPTKAEVLAGTGTGYVGHRDIAIASTNATTMTAATAITGLADGTDYECFAVLTEPTTLRTWMATQGFTASASTSTISFTDSDEQMAMRARNSINENLAYVDAQKAVIGGIDIGNYECSHDYFFSGASTPAPIRTLCNSWINSATHAEVYAMMYTSMASRGMKVGPQFGDINSQGDFTLTTSLYNLTDPKRLAFEAFGGTVAVTTPLAIGPVAAPDVATEPSFPFVVYTFPDPTLTYQLYNDDGKGNYAVVGDELRMINDIGIDWGSPTARTVTIEARNDYTSDIFDVAFSTGFAWYEATAKFAWDSIADNDSAAINPIIGGSMALTGTAATIASGLWDMGEAGRYTSSTAMLTTINANNPILLAAVLDKDNHTASFRFMMAFGGGSYFSLYNNSSNVLVGRWLHSTNTDQACAAANPTGKHVYWTFYDADPVTPKIHSGIDLTEFGTGTARNLAGLTFARDGTIGGIGANQSNMKHGSVQVLNEPGLTVGGILVPDGPIAKMMALHGI